MSEEWTAGLWYADHTDEAENGLPIGPSFVIGEPSNFNENGVVATGLYAEDAERIVACVNFCAGIPDDELVNLGSLIHVMQQAQNFAAAFRDNLGTDQEMGRIPPEWEYFYHDEIKEADEFCDLIKRILQSNGSDV